MNVEERAELQAKLLREARVRIAELEAALKQVACDCNGETGCKSYELYYKLCHAAKPSGEPK